MHGLVSPLKTNHHGNPQPSFLGVITHILGGGKKPSFFMVLGSKGTYYKSGGPIQLRYDFRAANSFQVCDDTSLVKAQGPGGTLAGCHGGRFFMIFIVLFHLPKKTKKHRSSRNVRGFWKSYLNVPIRI